jgi:DNA-binding GntR family transcriptional regulator
MSQNATESTVVQSTPGTQGWVDGRRTSGRKTGNMSDQVREYVYEQIVAGAFKPGSIIQIASIAAELGVSRTPVREALLALQQANVLSVIPNQGFLVKTMSASDIRDIYTMRKVLEAATAERAATNLSEDELARLDEINRESRDVAATGYSVEFDRCAHDFHRQIALGADSASLLAAVEAIFGDVRRLQSIGMSRFDPESILAEHREIQAALRSRNADAARAAMIAHIETLHRAALAHLIS